MVGLHVGRGRGAAALGRRRRLAGRHGRGLGHGNAAGAQQVFVGRRVDEPGVGITVHECVDLQLSFVEGVLRRRDHVPVDDLSNPGIQAHLKEIELVVVTSSVFNQIGFTLFQ